MSEASTNFSTGVAEKNGMQNALLNMEIGLLRYWIPSLIAFGILLFALLGFSVVVFRFMMNPIKEDVARLEAGQQEIRMEIKEIKTDITEFKAEFKTEITGIKTEITGIKTDIKELKSELTEIKALIIKNNK